MSDNPFSFLRERSFQKHHCTRKQSIRQMKYSYAYQTNILNCMNSILRKNYVGKLGAKWTFPSDHLPVGAKVGLFNVASWNVLNEAYIFWIKRDVQGLKESSMLQPKNKEREELVIKIVIAMLEHKTHPKQFLALQECSPKFLKTLENRLPPNIELIYRKESSLQNVLAILYDKFFFNLKSMIFSYPFSTAPDREIIDLVCVHQGEPFRFINTHLPGDPASPARFELVSYLMSQGADKESTILLGDMNFTEWEMMDALARRTENFLRCPVSYHTNIGTDLYAKRIDHIFTEKNLSAHPLQPNEVLDFLEPHTALL
jgi:hypothetical protein